MDDYIEIGSKKHVRAAVCMLLGSIVSFAIMYSPQPLISLFSEKYGISPSAASASISLTTIALAVSLLFVPALSGFWGRKKMMSLSLLLTSLFAIVSVLVDSFEYFLVFRLLEGISIAGFPSIAMAYLNEEFSPRTVGRVMGIYVGGTAIGGFFGRIVIGTLTDLFNWQTAMLIMGVISLLFSLWFWRYLPASTHFTSKKVSIAEWVSGIKAGLSSKSLLCMYATGFLLMGVYITVLDYIGYPLTREPYNLSQTVFGFLFVVNLVGTWSSVWFGKMADRYPRRHVVALALAIFVGGSLLTLSPVLALKIAGVAMVAFAFFAGHSVASSWVGILAGRKYKAQASSFYLLFYYSGSSLVGWSGGLFLGRFGWNGLIVYLLVLLGVGVLVSSRTGDRSGLMKNKVSA
ncbi:MFS transporter [Paenibacillus caui]|uniref:MFS transporter n=1 Tax=Paenibacillus caui TaxID=2873927 RepID=UPI0030803ECD